MPARGMGMSSGSWMCGACQVSARSAELAAVAERHHSTSLHHGVRGGVDRLLGVARERHGQHEGVLADEVGML